MIRLSRSPTVCLPHPHTLETCIQRTQEKSFQVSKRNSNSIGSSDMLAKIPPASISANSKLIECNCRVSACRGRYSYMNKKYATLKYFELSRRMNQNQ